MTASSAWCGWLLPAAAGIWLASCTYDFDAAFSEAPTTPTGSGATGGTTHPGGGGTGGTGGGSPTAGSGGVGGGGGQGTGAQSGGENCANNVDDDDDDYVDCADPDCVPDWECTQPAPTDWEGPAMFAIGTPGTLPSCAAPWGTELPGGNGLTVPDAVCNGCGCDAPTISCEIGDLRLYDFMGCGGVLDTVSANNPNTCETENGPTPESFRAYAGSPQPGSHCTPNGGGVQSLPPATWDEEARICTGTVHVGGCTNNNLCVPRDELSPFARCIYRSGVFPSCPTGSPYTDRYQFNATMTEGRSCTDCECDSPTNIQCDGTYRLWDNPSDCGSLPHDLEVSTQTGQCEDDDTIGSSYAQMFVPAYTADACSVSTGAGDPTGDVTEADPYTVCCLP